MTVLDIPDNGLALRSKGQPGEPATTRAQFMRLALAQSTLDDLISSMQKGQSAKVRLGKHPSLQFNGKTESFHAYPETHRSEIYETSSDKRTLYFAGVLSHSLEIAKAKEDTEDVDRALETLQAGLSAHEREKEAKQSYLVSNPDELKALAKVNKGNRMSVRSGGPRDKSRRLGVTHIGNGSLHPSPKLGAPESPALAPTSAPSQSKADRRLEALKTPFIHLLAVRAVSSQYLARLTHTSQDECNTLAKKFGTENRLNREKFDLKDKTYKDLDVWKFPYPTEEDRENAIQNAISAFDRMRISRTDKLWQSLLPKEERGKGKCLSRLNLHITPAMPTTKKTTGTSTTPRIQVDGAEDRAEEIDRAKGSGVTSRLTRKPRTEKDGTKKQVKGKSADNSTLTGRITKKTTGKAAPPKTDSKFKSAEFVHSSDEDDDEMPDAPSPLPESTSSSRPKENKPATASASTSTLASTKKPQPLTKTQPAKNTAPASSKASKAPAPAHKLESSHATPASKRPASRTSTSPQKPSPLGYSPPAAASGGSQGRSRSDSQNQSSGSSSSSPLISQLARNNKATGTAARPQKPVAPANGVSKPAPTKSSALPTTSVKTAPAKLSSKPVPAKPTSTKPTSSTSAAARPKPTRPDPTPAKNVDNALSNANPRKRKAEPDVGSESDRDGHPIITGNLEHKRRRAVSTSSGSTGSASPSMTQEVLRKRLLDKSEKFKEYYAKYSALHQVLAGQANPPAKDVDKLEKQHKRLQQMKQEIWDENRRLREEGVIS
ncbi:hypothetical protein N7532_008868 [Penicillium argentinense]|uniref:Uncharacterized protein n=1 Tax=Penicillium argentinense TaxID=1131581 RepID=A0A9W9EY76_9EURO|nr:uncharacterized protein N7532_008868 [Penicillium argentinense]KAJ5090184.1 hypothetical protein N7532_008868 [Penicillium argentinense]